jgi:tetratricopeptide (TPR) repeat protein
MLRAVTKVLTGSLILLTLGSCVTSHVERINFSDVPPTQRQMLALLRSGDFALLDERYGAIQDGYESHSISDEGLRAAFRVFYLTDPALAPSFDSWVERSPNSYVAHLARGIYFNKIGIERRGGDSIEQTSAEQLRGMEEAFEIATGELQKSLSLTRRPILSYLYWIEISRYVGSQQDTGMLFDRAIKLDPHSVILREMYMTALQTAWGGSQDAMLRFLESCRAAGLSAAHLRILEGVIASDRAWVEYYQKEDYEAAAKDYVKAYELSSDAGCLRCAADAYQSAGDYSGAIDTFSRLLSNDPNDADALYRRGWLYMNHQRQQDGVADFQRLTALGDPRGELALARLYLTGNAVPEDRAKGLEMLHAAADQDYLPAKSLLELVNQNEFPPPSPHGK